MPIFSFTGTHGTSKSTSAFQMAKSMKMVHPKKSLMLHMENVAMCPYPINKVTTSEAQLWIFTSHIKKDLDLLSKFDIIVSDRTAVDAIAYTMAAGYDSMAYAMVEVVRHHLRHYEKIIMKMAETNNFCFSDGIRMEGESEYRLEVERCLIEIYDNLGCEVERE